jgi:hypothetical protein
MKSIAVFVLFLGMFLIVQGYYQQKLQAHQQKADTSVKVKFIPRSVYEDQLSNDQKVSQQFKSMFDDISTWPSVRG